MTSTSARKISPLGATIKTLNPNVKTIRASNSTAVNQDKNPFKRRKMKRLRVVHRDGTVVSSGGDNIISSPEGSTAERIAPTANGGRFSTTRRVRTRHLPQASDNDNEQDNLAESSSDIVVRTRFPERRGLLPVSSGSRSLPVSLRTAAGTGLRSRDDRESLIGQNNSFRARRNHSGVSKSSNTSQPTGEIFFFLFLSCFYI